MKQTGKRKFNLVGNSVPVNNYSSGTAEEGKSTNDSLLESKDVDAATAAAVTAASKTKTTPVPSRFNYFDRNILQQFLVPTNANKDVMLHCEMDKLSLIYDKFPKARIHLLIVISDHFINAKTVKNLHGGHLHQLREVQRLVKQVCSEIQSSPSSSSAAIPNASSSEKSNISTTERTLAILDATTRNSLHTKLGSSKLKVGFHAIPSLQPLHIHIISDDMESDTMKNKKHWNSFTTHFFVDLDYVVEVLESNSSSSDKNEEMTFEQLLPEDVRSKYDDRYLENLLKKELCCHKCGEECRTIPQLKTHLQNDH